MKGALEAWLRHATPEMVGERGSLWDGLLFKVVQVWSRVPKEGIRFSLKKPQEVRIPGLYHEFYELALMDLFGLVRVEHASRPVVPWVPARIEHAPFGDAVLTLLGSRFAEGFFEILPDEDEEEEQEVDEPIFGAWQPLLQPYFPEWRQNLELPEAEERQGTFIFRVSSGKDVWRRIAMPADDSLDDLAGWILDSVDFDSDHLYEFIYRNRMGATVSIVHPEMDEEARTDEVSVGDVPLVPGQSMQFHFDFGDDWRFDVKLERIEPPGAKVKAPAILEKHGEAPEQYPDSDW